MLNNDTNPLLALEPLSHHFASVFDLGVALEPEVLESQGDTVAHHFRRLTAENAMKWGVLCPSPGRYEWQRADAIADFARKHDMRMTGHALLWHQMQPHWLFELGGTVASKSSLTEYLRDHIFRTVERYADVVDNWDVVNEAVSDRPGEIWRNGSEHSKWFEVFGNEDFVELAFRLASEATARFAPKTQLYYNDYDIECDPKRGRTLEMLRILRGKGVRIDGVGIQGHIRLKCPDVKELGSTIDAFAAQQLQVKVSELDVSVYSEDDYVGKSYEPEVQFSAELDAAIAERYVDVFRTLVSRAASLTSVVLWGLDDSTSWLNRFPTKRANYPLLIGREQQPKLALRRLLQLAV